MFHHIIIEVQNKKDSKKYFVDLDVTNLIEIIEDYVMPYIKNETFYIDGKEVSKEDILDFGVFKTEKKAATLMRELNNKDTPFAFLIFNEIDAVKQRQYDITKDCIKDAQKRLNISNDLKENEKTYFSKNNLHHLITKVSYKKYTDGYYADSVESAFKEIITRLKRIYLFHKKEEKDGVDLVDKIFGTDKPLLKLANDIKTKSGKNEQEGYRFIFRGCVQAIRNTKAHENQNIDAETALDRLVLASLLMKKIDQALIYSKIAE